MSTSKPANITPSLASLPPLSKGHFAGKPLAVFLLLCLIWGSTWVFIKLGLEEKLPPFDFASMRFIIAAAMLFAVNLARRVPLIPRSGSEWRLVSLTGFLTFTVNYGALFWGEQYIDSGLAALLQATIPAFGLVIAHYYLPGEQLSWRKILGVALGLLGVGIILSDQFALAGKMALWGSAALVVGSLSVAYSNVLIKARLSHLDSSMMASWQMVFGLLPLLAVGLLTEGNPLRLHWTPRALFCLGYLALVGTSLAFFLVYWLVRQIDVTKTLLISLVTPVMAVIIGSIVLREALSWRTAVGGGCVLLGIALVVIRKSAQSPAVTPSDPTAEAV